MRLRQRRRRTPRDRRGRVQSREVDVGNPGSSPTTWPPKRPDSSLVPQRAYHTNIRHPTDFDDLVTDDDIAGVRWTTEPA